ncbi:AEC family transporter [Sinomicrobium oceani]|uniref:AEC family transporter n=1 Tax=Sinomicrobium oceani TaxID=1150368 RepID=UPI00227AB944|nr:permease [Sinomicrobium oceani]
MEIALQKTMAFILFICIGVLMKQKFRSPDEINGLKKIILNLALPAMIFAALLRVDIDPQLLLLPVLAITFNGIIFYIGPMLLRLSGLRSDSQTGRTARILLPSLAPGLSCFPFITEFLGETFLAKAAMADLGNKIFVLVMLYITAMQWYYRQNPGNIRKGTARIKELLSVLVKEPVNMVILVAVCCIGFGISLREFPVSIREVIERTGTMMTPLVLLFIGLAIKIRKAQFRIILSLLFTRAGVSLLPVVLGCMLFRVSPEDVLLAVAFVLSSCSFWPFVHISGISQAEIRDSGREKTFDSDFALAILAFSLPISTLLILGILSCGPFFSSPVHLTGLAVFLLITGWIPSLFRHIMFRFKLPSPVFQKFTTHKPNNNK